ncbi:peptidoglycan DD-metalloendopeptidase family protein [Chitinophaga sp. HK235]|uniref:peptidoglycan DD-metalloendopeptidase family protein n=1 Tax=Chitinophaga sp. HK235 TaxID=2952571 RepID=UPI001BA6F7E6|nr:peptidoglycan DD-metalloendopeptidase family protein [Chitinophaga sp. HK235]
MTMQSVTPTTPARHLVCEGALCSCDKAAAPIPVKVISHQRYYIHGIGTSRLIVTSHENDQRALNFGGCLATSPPVPCTAALLWHIPVSQRRIQLANGAYPLPDNATATCIVKGGQIRILTHGQLPGDSSHHSPFETGNFPSSANTTTISPASSPDLSETTPGIRSNTIICLAGPDTVTTEASWEVQFALPPTPEEISFLYWVLEDEQGNQENMLHGDIRFTHHFQLHGQFTLRVFSGATSETMLSKMIEVVPSGLSSTHTHCRPGETVTFTLHTSQTDHPVNWVQTDEKGNTSPLATTSSNSIQQTFVQPGSYVIQAITPQQTWQLSITVCQNLIQSIHTDQPTITGSTITFHIQRMVFPEMSLPEKNKLHWKLEGPENTHCQGVQAFRHHFTLSGNYTLYAYLYDIHQEAKLQFTVQTAMVHSGKWIDADGQVIRQAGYNQEIGLYFEHTGLETQKVQLEIYARQTLRTTLILAETLQLPASKKVYYQLNTNKTFQQKIPQTWNGREAHLYFQIKTTTFPLLHSDRTFPGNHTEHLLITEKQQIVKAYFTDMQEQRTYFVTDHHREIALKIYAINLNNTVLDITLLRLQSPHHLQRPLTLYPITALQPQLTQHTVLHHCQCTVDKKGTVFLKVPLNTLQHYSLIYALIKLPGFNAVYTPKILVYPAECIKLKDPLKASASTVIERVRIRHQQSCESLVWGNHVSCAFRKKVINIAQKLQADPNHLMTCMAFETGGSFLPHLLSGYRPANTPAPEVITDKQLSNHAVGLVQFTGTAIRDINQRFKSTISKKQLTMMTAEDQLDYVYQYLLHFKGRLNTLEDFYMTILKPEGTGKHEDYIVFSKQKDFELHDQWYEKNKGLDSNHDFTITKKEVSIIIHKKYTEGLSHKNSCEHNCPLSIDTKSSSDQHWHHPIDNIQLRGWYNCWDPDRSRFGIIANRKSGKHQGLDFYARQGSPVYACVNGIITASYYSASYGYVVILNGDYSNSNYYFFYAHLQNQSKYNTGDNVTAGTTIGYTGKTGNANNVEANQEHLHFEIRTKSSVGRGFDGRLDPIQVIKELDQIAITNPQKNQQNANAI